MGILENARFLLGRLTGRARPCAHSDQIRAVRPGTTAGCPECLAAGDTWVHLRMCMTCGQVGCCDSSKNRHATRHAQSAQHPILSSLEPGDDWMWCVVDRHMVARPRA